MLLKFCATVITFSRITGLIYCGKISVCCFYGTQLFRIRHGAKFSSAGIHAISISYLCYLKNSAVMFILYNLLKHYECYSLLLYPILGKHLNDGKTLS